MPRQVSVNKSQSVVALKYVTVPMQKASESQPNPDLGSSVFPLMDLTLAPGIGGKNDYYVPDDGRRIGRIFLSSQAPVDHPWFWGIFPPPVGNEGYAATREQAMAAFKARWLQSRDPVRLGAQKLKARRPTSGAA
jgi:hypothetical protein